MSNFTSAYGLALFADLPRHDSDYVGVPITPSIVAGTPQYSSRYSSRGRHDSCRPLTSTHICH